MVKNLRVYAPFLMLFREGVDNDYKPSMGFFVGMLEEVQEIIGVYKGRVRDYKLMIDIIEAKGRID